MMNETGTWQQKSQWRPATWAARTKPALLERVAEARVEAVDAGLRPTEVWLGPAEYSELEQSRAFHRSYLDLQIRRMAEDGVRVGCTFAGQEEE